MKGQGQLLMNHLGQCYITYTMVTTIAKYDLGDGGYRSMGYITLTKMAHQLLSLTFHLNVLIGHQKCDLYFK